MILESSNFDRKGKWGGQLHVRNFRESSESSSDAFQWASTRAQAPSRPAALYLRETAQPASASRTVSRKVDELVEHYDRSRHLSGRQ